MSHVRLGRAQRVQGYTVVGITASFQDRQEERGATAMTSRRLFVSFSLHFNALTLQCSV